jgi:hypothetical protein
VAVKTKNITTGASAVQVFPPGNGAGQFDNTVGTVSDPISTIIVNEDATNSVRLGPSSTVTASAGLLVKAGGSLPWEWIDDDMATLYVIAVAGTPAVSVIATRQNG